MKLLIGLSVLADLACFALGFLAAISQALREEIASQQGERAKKDQ